MESYNEQNKILDIVPDKIRAMSTAETMMQPIIPGFQNSGSGVSPVKALKSLNFTSNRRGWSLANNGEVQSNGNKTIAEHFVPAMVLHGTTIYISDANSPHNVLDGATGDICLHGDGGKIYFCIGGKTWTAPA
jgi:hypothetical protein